MSPRLHSIHEVTHASGTTSRTLRHYDAIGLLPPTATSHSGQRFYDDAALVTLQQILVLRELDVKLADIATALTHSTIEEALSSHLSALRAERSRIDRLIGAVEHTRTALRTGEPLMRTQMFDGFDHNEYREEVQERWGAQAWRDSSTWWGSTSAAERTAFTDAAAELSAAWRALADSGADPASKPAQALADRHAAWLRSIPGTPAATGAAEDLKAYLVGLGDMYAQDPRFAANYGGPAGGAFVRDALRAWVDRH